MKRVHMIRICALPFPIAIGKVFAKCFRQRHFYESEFFLEASLKTNSGFYSAPKRS